MEAPETIRREAFFTAARLHDYLTVPDPMIRRIESVLTLLGGKVVHAAGPFAYLKA